MIVLVGRKGNILKDNPSVNPFLNALSGESISASTGRYILSDAVIEINKQHPTLTI